MTCVKKLVEHNISLRSDVELYSNMSHVGSYFHLLLGDLYRDAKDNADCAEILREYVTDCWAFAEKHKEKYHYASMIVSLVDKGAKLIKIRSGK